MMENEITCRLEYEKSTGFTLHSGTKGRPHVGDPITRVWNDTCIDLLQVMAEDKALFTMSKELFYSLPMLISKNQQAFNCRWCDLGIERRRDLNGTWRHLREDPKPYLINKGYGKSVVSVIGDQWTEITDYNNLCKSMRR